MCSLDFERNGMETFCLMTGLSTTDFLGEKHRRQTEKIKCSAHAEVVQPLPNLPAPAEVCPAPVSTAEV